MPDSSPKEALGIRIVYGIGYGLMITLGNALTLFGIWQCFAAGVLVGFGDDVLMLFLVVPLGLAGILLLVIGTHELGHLLAGLAVGMRIQSLLIGFLRVERHGRGVRVRLQKRRLAVDGYVMAMPVGHRQLLRRYAIFTVGGPVASSLACAIATVAAVALQVVHEDDPRNLDLPALVRTFITPASWAVVWLNLTALANVFGVVSLLPFRAGAFLSDGALLLAYLRASRFRPGSAESRRSELTFLAMSLMGTCASGVRPRDWDLPIVERMLGLRDGYVEDVSANLTAFYHAHDSGRIEQAGLLLDLAMSQKDEIPKENQEGLLLEAAYYEGRYRRNAAVALQWLSAAKPGQAERQTRLRAEAAVLYAQGEYGEAERKAEEALRIVDDSIDRGGAIAEREWLQEMVHAISEEQKRVSTGDNLVEKPMQPLPLH